jgi:S-DNA-T family DNA segregation ATPase FtsK/SpoIIIE
VGVILLLLGMLGFLHIVGVPADETLQVAYEGRGGGYAGFLLSFPLRQALSTLATALIFIAAFLVGAILTFRVSPAEVWQAVLRLFSRKDAEEAEGVSSSAEDAGVLPPPRFRVNALGGASTAAAPATPARAGSRVASPQSQAARRYRPSLLKLLHPSARQLPHDKATETVIKDKIKQTFEHFGIEVEMGETNVGPTVTQYTLRPAQGTKLSRITALQNDLALALAAHPIRIEAPIPNKDLVGIEIPNRTPILVRLRDLLTSPSYKQVDSPLAFVLGKDVAGRTVVDTLERLPHLLIAGATGSGKSVSIHTLLVSWLYRNSPQAVQFILIDPKRVELPVYNGIPHLLAPVIVDPDKAIHALKWTIDEMDRRYHMLEETGARNLMSYNMSNPDEAKPFIVLVIDELADLMVKHAREIEGPIVRLSQMARAVGIHLVLATQRPSVNVLTGLIKANIPARIAFSVASQVDSRTIIDMAGSEKLLGNGDMLYLPGDKEKPLRIQGGFVSEDEVRAIVSAVCETGEPNYDDSITHPSRGERGVVGDTGDDTLFEEAKRLVIQTGKASASLLQRRLRVGYARAARLLDMLEEQNVISAAEGNKPRVVLSSDEEAVADTTDIADEDTEDVSGGGGNRHFQHRQW